MTNWEIQGVRLDGKASIDAWDISILNTATISNGLTISAGGAAITGNSTLGGNLAITGDLTGTGDITRTGDSAITGDITGTGDITRTGNLALTGNITGTGDITRTGDSAITGNITVAGNITGTGDLTRTGTISLTNTTTGTAGMLVNSTDAAGDSQLELRTTGGSAFVFTNQDGNTDFYSNEQIRFGHAGSFNTTSFWLGASTNSFSKEGFSIQTTASSGTNVTEGMIKVNPNSEDIDFSISSDNVADLIKVDAGNDTFTLKAQTLPSTPSTGTLAIDSGDSNTLKFYDGSSWTAAGGGGSASGISTGTKFSILNKIRQQIDRSVDISLDEDDIFSDAYIDADGRENTVNIGNTDSTFSTNKYQVDNLGTSGPLSTETIGITHSPNANCIWKGIINADCIFTEVGFYLHGTGTMTITIYDDVWTQVAQKVQAYGSTGLQSMTFTISDYSSLLIATKQFRVIAAYTSNLEIAYPGGYFYSNPLFMTDATYVDQYFGNNGFLTAQAAGVVASGQSVVEQTIPSGTFPSTISSLIGKSLVSGIAPTCTIKHKLTNATEDSGWIDDGVIGSFTAFTSEPTKYIIQLTGASGTPVSGEPNIKGSGVYSE